MVFKTVLGENGRVQLPFEVSLMVKYGPFFLLIEIFTKISICTKIQNFYVIHTSGNAIRFKKQLFSNLQL